MEFKKNQFPLEKINSDRKIFTIRGTPFIWPRKDSETLELFIAPDTLVMGLENVAPETLVRIGFKERNL